MNAAQIKKEAQDLMPTTIKWRRHLHQIPELGINTVETAKYICACLDEMGIPYKTHVGGPDCHSVVALIEGPKPGKCFALRTDIDGLPMVEETGLDFAAKNGNMHACGHDAHAAIGLSAAKLLKTHQNEIHGSVKLIFQPAEEGCPEGPGGAKRMLDDGVLQNPTVDAMMGLHVGTIFRHSVVPGEIGLRYSTFMSCMDRFSLIIKGRGTHGAMPEGGIDPVPIAAQVVSALQTIVSREVDPQTPAVISICEISGGSAFNIIPGEVRLQGTIRAFNNDLRKYLAERIGAVAQGVATSMRGAVEYDFNWDGPGPVINNEALTREFEEVAQHLVGPEHVREMARPSMGGEDIAFFFEKVPGTYFFLPCYDNSLETVYAHHNTHFCMDERYFWIGSASLAAMALQWLEKHS